MTGLSNISPTRIKILLMPKESDQLMELAQIENLLKAHLTDATEIHVQG